MSIKSYDNISNFAKDAARIVAERSMRKAASDLRGDSPTADISVSVDGTWQREGFSSLNRVVTAISVDSGKVLDSAILSKSCKGCTNITSFEKTNPDQFNLLKASNNCQLNYHGSSPNMEKVGAIKFFNRSLEKYNLYYTSFYGDGDSKAFASVQNIYVVLKSQLLTG